MTSPAVGAAGLLSAAGVGVTTGSTGWRITVGQHTDQPNTQITTVDSGGSSPNPKFLLNFAHFQCRIRGAIEDYAGAYSKAKDVQDVLLGLDPQDVDGDHWSGVIGLGDINFLSYDEKRRPMFSINFQVFLERPTNSLTHRESL